MYQPQFQQQQQPVPPPPFQHPQAFYPQYYQPPPIHQVKPVIIKQPGLFYDGNQFMKFLKRFERTANTFQATDYDKALQIGQFLRTEELKSKLKEMDRYDDCYWKKLRKKCIKYEDPGLLFLIPFSRESQENIKRTLLYNGQLPTGKDGNTKAPQWNHLVAATETEVIRIEERYKQLHNLEQELVELRKQVKALGLPPDYNHQLNCSEKPLEHVLEPAIEIKHPVRNIAETKTEIPEPMMDVTETEPENYSQELVFEQAASTIQLPDTVVNQKSAKSNLMDTAMGLKHIVIDILEFGPDSVDTAIGMDQEEILDQS
ncbi:hypothetical protein PTTG_30579, partial [Puccinia triticina 1-1 BBBD Race 1]